MEMREKSKEAACAVITDESSYEAFVCERSKHDDPLTEKPERISKLVGRARGTYAFASQHDFGLLMVMNSAFSGGIYNGSALGILGRNPLFNTVREMPIVEESGIFRSARGYALAKAKTVWFNKNGDAIVESNVTVVHY